MNNLKDLLNDITLNAMHFGSDYADGEDHALMTTGIEQVLARDKLLLDALLDMVESYQYEASSDNPSLLNAKKILKDNGVELE